LYEEEEEKKSWKVEIDSGKVVDKREAKLFILLLFFMIQRGHPRHSSPEIISLLEMFLFKRRLRNWDHTSAIC